MHFFFFSVSVSLFTNSLLAWACADGVNDGVSISYVCDGSGSGNGRYECPLCGIVFLDAVTVRSHIELHYPRESSQCPVPSCAKSFIHPNSVRNHMRMKHSAIWSKMKQMKSQLYDFQNQNVEGTNCEWFGRISPCFSLLFFLWTLSFDPYFGDQCFFLFPIHKRWLKFSSYAWNALQ